MGLKRTPIRTWHDKEHGSRPIGPKTTNTHDMPTARPKLYSVKEEDATAKKAKPHEVCHPQEDCAGSHDGNNDHNNNSTNNTQYNNRHNRQHEQQQLRVPDPLRSRSCPDGQPDVVPHDHLMDKKKDPDYATVQE